MLGRRDLHGSDQISVIWFDAGITSESLAQPPVQLVVGDADETFREAAAALAPLVNVTSVVAPPNAGDSAYVHSALCYAHALELCSQHARRASLHSQMGADNLHRLHISGGCVTTLQTQVSELMVSSGCRSMPVPLSIKPVEPCRLARHCGFAAQIRADY